MRASKWLVVVGLPVLSVGMAFGLTRLLGLQVVGGVSPMFFAAVAVSAYVGGFRSGIIATGLASGCTALLFQHPYSIPNLGVDDLVRLLAFTAVAMMISSLQHASETARLRLAAASAQAEQARDAAVEANLAKDRFLNVLGHELRNPLVPILSITSQRLQELCASGPRAPGWWPESLRSEELREDLETIRRNVEVEARLIDDLLDSRRIHTGKLCILRQPSDLSALLAEAVQFIRPAIESRGLRLETRTVSAMPRSFVPVINGDPTRLRQIFWNLLNNAAKFTRSGRVHVTLRPARRGRSAVISVADTGIGMSSGEIRRIFHPFSQVHDAGDFDPQQRPGALSGLGLGLSIVAALVEAHGGSVRVRSRRGHGSVFRVHLPVTWREPAFAAGAQSQDRGVSRHVSARPLRVLVVDDHRDTARATARLLSRAGYEVDCASSVAEAMAKASQAHFDLLLSDVGLPDGTGHDLMQQLRSRLRGIAISGYGGRAEVARSIAAGFSFHLMKPVDPERLIEHIERVGRPSGVA